MMLVGYHEVQTVVKPEHIRFTFIINDARMVSGGLSVRFHYITLEFPGAYRAGTHCITDTCISHIIVPILLVCPRTLLKMIRVFLIFYLPD